MYKSGSFDKMLSDMKNGVYDFTDDGKCSSCGSCCSDLLPVTYKEVQTIRDFIKKHGIQEQKHMIPFSEPHLDMTCPFRDNDGERCVIYPVRPMICRDFKCDNPSKGIGLDPGQYEHGEMCIISMRSEFFA